MYTDKRVDSRNIAGFEIILIVEDVQDTPPVFLPHETIIKLASNVTQVSSRHFIVRLDHLREQSHKIYSIRET